MTFSWILMWLRVTDAIIIWAVKGMGLNHPPPAKEYDSEAKKKKGVYTVSP